ncbi:unnamed protein product [Discula destructiva]
MASQPSQPLKGILKKPTPTPTTSSLPTASNNNPRDPRTIAHHHATLLQTRKETESQIFDNTLALLDLPHHAAHPPSAPHPSDAATFTHLVRIFQPSDYDDLITERNLTTDIVPAGRCGYALCGRARRRFPSAGRYKMVNKGRKSFDIVETAELERWCSAECTRRALWIKVQLSETAAWERAGLPELSIELYPQKNEEATSSEEISKAEKPAPAGQEQGKSGHELATDMAKLQLEQDDKAEAETEKLAAEIAELRLAQDRKAAQDKAALAIERGDDARTVSTRAVGVLVREKKVTTQPEAPSLGTDATENTIEGYRPKFRADIEGESEDEDRDWL